MNFPLIFESLPALLGGLWLTLQILALSLLFGAVLAAFVTFVRMRAGRFARALAGFYIWLFRGTPAIVQLFVIYYGLAQFSALRESFLWIALREPFWCCVLAFSLNSGAYTSEILRGAISGIPDGQWDAAKALGFRARAAFATIIWPQAWRLAAPPYSNEVVGMLKTTALASTVTLSDITGVAETIASRTFAPYEVFISAAIIYLVLAWLLQSAIRLAVREPGRLA